MNNAKNVKSTDFNHLQKQLAGTYSTMSNNFTVAKHVNPQKSTV